MESLLDLLNDERIEGIFDGCPLPGKAAISATTSRMAKVISNEGMGDATCGVDGSRLAVARDVKLNIHTNVFGGFRIACEYDGCNATFTIGHEIAHAFCECA